MINYKKDIIPIIKKAGSILCNHFSQKRIVYEKGLSNYVTDLDYAIENVVVGKIKTLFPNDIVTTEEHILKTNTKDYWILDPIDGTTNLLHQYNSVAISLAHVINNESIFGVVYNPLRNELFYAEKNKGAFLETDKNLRKISVTKKKSLSTGLIGFGFPYDKSKVSELLSILNPIITKCDDLKRLGPASLDICYVAAGYLDAYLELDLESWDYAAGRIILSEAKGMITNFENTLPVSKSNILASNGLIHNELINIISSVRK